MKKTMLKKVILMMLCFLLSACGTGNSGLITTFCAAVTDFEEIKNLVIYNGVDSASYGILRDESNSIVGLYGLPEPMTQEHLNSLNSIDEIFKTDFSFIEVSKGCVRFGGNGGEMFVFMANGNKPIFFYFEGDGVEFSASELTNGWFFLHSKVR